MKLTNVLNLCLCGFFSFVFSSNAFAGNGHVDSAPEIQVDAVSSDGIRSVNVTGTLLSNDEIIYTDLARKFIVAKNGSSAKTWPIMIDLEGKQAQFLIKSENRFVTIAFSELLGN